MKQFGENIWTYTKEIKVAPAVYFPAQMTVIRLSDGSLVLHSPLRISDEMAEKIKENIEGINWIDLWHNQVGFLVEEHPFPTPALFLAFRILSVEDLSEKVQRVQLQIDLFYFYETFLDTYNGAYNETDALDYLNNLQPYLYHSYLYLIYFRSNFYI